MKKQTLTKRKQKTKKDNYHHGDLKEALVETAIKLLKKNGINAITMRNVAAKAGVSHAAAYRHFQDKEELLAEIAIDGFKKLAKEVSLMNINTNKESFLEVFINSGVKYVNFAIENNHQYRLMFNRNKTNIEKFPELKKAADETFHTELCVIKSCIENKIFKETNPEMIALTAWSLMHGVSMLFIDGVLTQNELFATCGLKSLNQNIEEMIKNISNNVLTGFLK